MMSHNNQEVFYGHPAEYYQNQDRGEDLYITATQSGSPRPQRCFRLVRTYSIRIAR